MIVRGHVRLIIYCLREVLFEVVILIHLLRDDVYYPFRHFKVMVVGYYLGKLLQRHTEALFLLRLGEVLRYL